MTENFAKNFVDLSGPTFGPQRGSELRLNHRKRGLYVRPLVIVGKEILAPELKVVEHPTPQFRSFASGVGLERDVRSGSYRMNRCNATPREVCFVRRYFGDRKPLRRGFDQRRELRGVASIAVGDFNASNDMGVGSHHQVGLNPLPFIRELPVLLVVPASEGAGRKAAGVHGECCLHRFQWGGALFDQSFEDRRKSGLLQIIRDAVVMGGFRNMALLLAVTQLASGASARACRVDLHASTENNVSKWEPGPSLGLWRRRDSIAETPHQFKKTSFFVGLCRIVRGPFLPEADTNSLGDYLGSVRSDFLAHNKFDTVHVLALDAACLMVGAGTSLLLRVNYVAAIDTGRDDPERPLLAEFLSRRKLQSTLFTILVHGVLPFLTMAPWRRSIKLYGLLLASTVPVSGCGSIECYKHSVEPLLSGGPGGGRNPLKPGNSPGPYPLSYRPARSSSQYSLDRRRSRRNSLSAQFFFDSFLEPSRRRRWRRCTALPNVFMGAPLTVGVVDLTRSDQPIENRVNVCSHVGIFHWIFSFRQPRFNISNQQSGPRSLRQKGSYCISQTHLRNWIVNWLTAQSSEVNHVALSFLDALLQVLTGPQKINQFIFRSLKQFLEMLSFRIHATDVFAHE